MIQFIKMKKIQSLIKNKKLDFFIILLAIAFIFLTRIQTYDDILYDGKIIFTSYDSYYHARLIQNTVHNFPHRTWFDSYSLYPFGQPVMFGPLYDTLAAFVAIIIGFGNPSNFLIEIIAAIFPMLFAILSVPLVYLISRISFNRLSAIISVLVFSLMNGEFLHRSMFGNADHHIAELFFSLLFVLFFIIALKRKKILHFSIAGFILGCYFLVWYGAVIFYFILILFLIAVYFTQNKKYSLKKITLLSFFPLLFYLIFAAGYSPYSLDKKTYLLIFISPIALSFLTNKIKNYNKKILIGSLGILISLLAYFQFQIRRMLISPIKYMISNKVASEMDSIFSYSSLSLSFYLLLFISIISLFLLFYNAKKSDIYLFIGLWSCVIILSSILQIRFSYYLPANIAILAGYIATKLKIKKYLFTYIFLILLIIMPLSIETYKRAYAFSPNLKEIYQALEWMKNNTPKLDIDYYAYYDKPEKVSSYMVYGDALVCENEKIICVNNPCLSYNHYRTIKPDNKIKNKSCKLFLDYPYYPYYNYPNSSYGIMNVYPYGHLITYIARRIPITNGFLFPYGLIPSEEFFTTQKEKNIKEILDNLNIKYLLLDDYSINAAQFMDYKFYDMQYAESGLNNADYVKEIKLENSKQKIYFQNYYKAVVTRLYLYDGNKHTPKKSYVLINNEIIKFKDYKSALEYREKNNNSIIVGIDPYESPIPLKEIEDFKLIYESNESIARNAIGELKKVKIFQYRK